MTLSWRKSWRRIVKEVAGQWTAVRVGGNVPEGGAATSGIARSSDLLRESEAAERTLALPGVEQQVAQRELAVDATRIDAQRMAERDDGARAIAERSQRLAQCMPGFGIVMAPLSLRKPPHDGARRLAIAREDGGRGFERVFAGLVEWHANLRIRASRGLAAWESRGGARTWVAGDFPELATW
jgi:hypothetical protein